MAAEATEELRSRRQHAAEIHALRRTCGAAALAVGTTDDECRQVVVLGETAGDESEYAIGPVIALGDQDRVSLCANLATCFDKHRFGSGLALKVEGFEFGGGV